MTTTARTKRRSPASDIATSKQDAVARGLRRFKTKACNHCRHLVKVIREDGSTACERCLTAAVLFGEEDNAFGTLTPEQRKALKNEAERIRKGAERGDPAHRVDKETNEAVLTADAREFYEHLQLDIAASEAAMRAEADLDVDWCRELMLRDPEAVREALGYQPWHHVRLDRADIDRVQRVFQWREAALVSADWIGSPVETTTEVRYFWENRTNAHRTEIETRADGAFEVAEEVAAGRAPGDQQLASAWLTARGHRWAPEWVSSRQLRELLALVPVAETTYSERDDDTGHVIGHIEDRRRLWSLVEPLVAERITLALEQRKEPLEPAEFDKVFDAELRRYQRYVRSLKERRDELKPGLERAALDFEIMDVEKHRPRPGPGYVQRKRQRECDAFMARLAKKHGDRLRPRAA